MSDESELELSHDEIEDFERATSPLLSYEKTETVKGRRMNNIPLRTDDSHASKQAYFDRAKPIFSA